MDVPASAHASVVPSIFKSEGAQLERFFSLEAYSRRDDVIQIGTDASPYGMGGWITVNERVKRYFGCPISDHDVKTYGQQRGSCNGQQVWDCLAVLVALDLWKWQSLQGSSPYD